MEISEPIAVNINPIKHLYKYRINQCIKNSEVDSVRLHDIENALYETLNELFTYSVINHQTQDQIETFLLEFNQYTNTFYPLWGREEFKLHYKFLKNKSVDIIKHCYEYEVIFDYRVVFYDNNRIIYTYNGTSAIYDHDSDLIEEALHYVDTNCRHIYNPIFEPSYRISEKVN